MSMSYWIISGIGLKSESIVPFISTEKIVRLFCEQLPDDPDLADMVSSGDYSSFDVEDYLYGGGFENLSDVLCHCDDTDTITFGDDGDGGDYFYYPPSMPWHHVENEPQSEEEVVSRIVNAVQRITDMTEEEIKNIVDTELYVVGFG